MYTIPRSSPGFFSARLLGIGVAWVLGYTLLGLFGGALAFGLMNYFYTTWEWSQSLVIAWIIVALLCAPLAIWIQYRVLRPSGLVLRDWIRASWITFLLLGVASGIVVGGTALITRQSPVTLLTHPIMMLEALELILESDIRMSETSVVLMFRGLAGLLIGVTQAQVWRKQRFFFVLWCGACTSAGLISYVGERLGVRLGQEVSDRLCTIPGWRCPSALVREVAYGGCYWAMTWLMMALVTVGPVLYLVRLQPQPEVADSSANEPLDAAS